MFFFKFDELFLMPCYFYTNGNVDMESLYRLADIDRFCLIYHDPINNCQDIAIPIKFQRAYVTNAP